MAMWAMAETSVRRRCGQARDFDKGDVVMRQLAVAVVSGDTTIYARGFGTTGRGTRVTPTSRFRLGSTTKSITALAIVQLDGDVPEGESLPQSERPDEDRLSVFRDFINSLDIDDLGKQQGEGPSKQ